jgi:antitoxin (DNA-binding transcriptional repressor) of toxin-antitoxin stability system
MKMISIAEAAKDLPGLLAESQADGEDIVLLQDGEPVATLSPEARGETAAEIFAELDGPLDEEAGAALQTAVDSIRNSPDGRLNELREPWVG